MERHFLYGGGMLLHESIGSSIINDHKNIAGATIDLEHPDTRFKPYGLLVGSFDEEDSMPMPLVEKAAHMSRKVVAQCLLKFARKYAREGIACVPAYQGTRNSTTFAAPHRQTSTKNSVFPTAMMTIRIAIWRVAR
jgi:hypothetical protein